MDTQESAAPEEYQAAVSGSAYYVWEAPGFLSISGADRLDFLQRQTTNDIRLLEPASCAVSALTNPAARILDLLTLVDESNSLLVITLPGHGGTTHQYLRSRIFFTDKVTVDNLSHEMTLIDLLGPGSLGLLAQLGMESALVENRVMSWEMAGGLVQGFIQRGLGYRLTCQSNQAHALLASLDRAGAIRLSYETFDLLRIEAGLPAGGQELTDEYTPLEAGLGWAVSASKGCYTGQEVIARQITYDKVTRQLAGLRLNQPVQAREEVFSAEEERQVGTITSAGISPRLGPIALAILRRPYDQPGTRVTLGNNNGLAATVVSLPF